MIILIKLILAHLIGDFPLQPNSWVEAKEQKKARSWILYIHAVLHGLLALLILGDLRLWHLALSISLIHYIVDLIKLYFQKEHNKSTWFVTDQVVHLSFTLQLFSF